MTLLLGQGQSWEICLVLEQANRAQEVSRKSLQWARLTVLWQRPIHVLLTVDLNWDRDTVRDMGSRAKEATG